MLARREHSEQELYSALIGKKFDSSAIHDVLAHLKSEGLLSNQRFTEAYVHYRRTKGYGPIRIRFELLERGITEDLIEQHIKIADNTWLNDAREVWKKRFKNRMPHDYRSRAQQMRFLQYRGFTQEHINSIFHSDE